jgi:CRP/FNR family transcriptional regulator
MPTPYNLPVQEHCATCTAKKPGSFCDLSRDANAAIDVVRFTVTYPKGSLLFVEGENPRGVFIICSGSVKLTTSSSRGKTQIVRLAAAGEVLGLDAVMVGCPYEVAAETAEVTQVSFVERGHFLRLFASRGELSRQVAKELSRACRAAEAQTRALGLSTTMSERLALWILDRTAKGELTSHGIRVPVSLTHEEIAQLIGSRRETVTRLLADFRRRRVIDVLGSNLFVLSTSQLRQIAHG